MNDNFSHICPTCGNIDSPVRRGRAGQARLYMPCCSRTICPACPVEWTKVNGGYSAPRHDPSKGRCCGFVGSFTGYFKCLCGDLVQDAVVMQLIDVERHLESHDSILKAIDAMVGENCMDFRPLTEEEQSHVLYCMRKRRLDLSPENREKYIRLHAILSRRRTSPFEDEGRRREEIFEMLSDAVNKDPSFHVKEPVVAGFLASIIDDDKVAEFVTWYSQTMGWSSLGLSDVLRNVRTFATNMNRVRKMVVFKVIVVIIFEKMIREYWQLTTEKERYLVANFIILAAFHSPQRETIMDSFKDDIVRVLNDMLKTLGGCDNILRYMACLH